MLADIFLQPTWLYAGLAIIPIILLYLLRPKPRKQTIPSLMFLMKDKGKKSLRGFLKKFIINTLLFIHLLAILLLAAALAQPYLQVPSLSSASNNIIVLDSSASMNAQDSTGTRADIARERAQNMLGRTNTIILAGEIPQVVLEQAERQEAQQYLRSWNPSDQPTKLRPAILEAQRYAQADTQLTIISDFADTERNTDYTDAIRTLQALGIQVQLEHIGEENTNNIGIIDVEARDTQTTVRIRNYNNQPTTFEGCVSASCREFSLQAQETQSWTFNTPPGVSEVTLNVQDNLELDNTAYISAEDTQSIRALIVTNQDFEQSSLERALQAIQETTPLTIEFSTNTPPALTTVDHDLIIFYEINPNNVVTRTIRDAQNQVEQGAAAIIMHQEALFSIPYEELLPVAYQDEGQTTSVLNTDRQRRYVGIDFGTTPTHYKTQATPEARIIAQTPQEEPLIVKHSLGRGNVLYYGLPDEASFSNNPEYPLFWKTVIDELLNRDNAQTLTRITGELIRTQETIQTPNNENKQGTILLEEAGTYQSSQRTLVANLANQQESNINAPAPTGEGVQRILNRENRSQEQTVTTYLLWAAILLLLIEIIYLKWRGDL